MTAIPGNFDLDYTRGIQKSLAEKLALNLTIDGNFGPASITALKQYQLKNGIPSTGVYDPQTQASIEPFLLSKFVTLQDFQTGATQLGVELASLKAIQETETAGAGFLYTGRPKILFERHWFLKFLQQGPYKSNAAGLQKLMLANPDIISATPGGYVGAVGEWPRFSRAFAIDAQSAMQSTSWGLFQEMGFNFADCGYANVGTFVDDMKLSEMKQLNASIVFIERNNGGRLQTDLQAKNWTDFARLYNGSGAVATYSAKMSSNYDLMKKMYG